MGGHEPIGFDDLQSSPIAGDRTRFTQVSAGKDNYMSRPDARCPLCFACPMVRLAGWCCASIVRITDPGMPRFAGSDLIAPYMRADVPRLAESSDRLRIPSCFWKQNCSTVGSFEVPEIDGLYARPIEQGARIMREGSNVTRLSLFRSVSGLALEAADSLAAEELKRRS